MTPGIPAPVLSRTTPLTLPSESCAHAGAPHISATSANANASGFCRCFFFQAEDGIRDVTVTGVQTCALPISRPYAATDGRDLNHDNNFADDFASDSAHRVIRPVAAWNNMYRTVDVRLAKVVPVGDRKSVV